MSTKIYNGFKFKNPNIVVIRKQLINFQKPVKEIIEKLCSIYIARITTTLLDTKAVGAPVEVFFKGMFKNSVKNESLPFVARRHISEVIREGEWPFDFKFKISVFPISSKLTLGIYYCGETECIELIQNQSWFISYEYFNNSDKPENISEKEWKTRGKHWDIPFPDDKSTCPCNCGFTMDITEPYIDQTPYMLTVEKIIDKIPSFNDRLQHTAENLHDIPLSDKEHQKLDREKAKIKIEKIKKQIKHKLPEKYEINDFK